jgi:hypothetical protein
VHDYVQACVDNGSNRLNLQHGDAGDYTVARWVDVVSWPYETTVKMTVPGEETRELVLPAGTVYMGVIWDEDAWPLVKSGKVTGLSLRGKALRVAGGDAAMPHMGDKLAMSAHGYVPQDSGGGVLSSQRRPISSPRRSPPAATSPG